jgi:hypothetical protein
MVDFSYRIVDEPDVLKSDAEKAVISHLEQAEKLKRDGQSWGLCSG